MGRLISSKSFCTTSSFFTGSPASVASTVSGKASANGLCVDVTVESNNSESRHWRRRLKMKKQSLLPSFHVSPIPISPPLPPTPPSLPPPPLSLSLFSGVKVVKINGFVFWVRCWFIWGHARFVCGVDLLSVL